MCKITAGTIALLAVAFGAHFALAASNQVYTTAPTTFVCAFVQVTDPNDTIRCTWDNNLGAPKYSVDTLANYELFAGGTQSVDLDFGAATTTIDIALSSFPTDPDLEHRHPREHGSAREGAGSGETEEPEQHVQRHGHVHYLDSDGP